MFSGGLFGGNLFAGTYFYGGGEGSLGATATTTWRKKNGAALAGVALDYWVIDAMDELIANGTGTTDSSGSLTVQLPQRYVGDPVLVVINNLATDMEPSGRIQGQQVVTAT